MQTGRPVAPEENNTRFKKKMPIVYDIGRPRNNGEEDETKRQLLGNPWNSLSLISTNPGPGRVPSNEPPWYLSPPFIYRVEQLCIGRYGAAVGIHHLQEYRNLVKMENLKTLKLEAPMKWNVFAVKWIDTRKKLVSLKLSNQSVPFDHRRRLFEEEMTYETASRITITLPDVMFIRLRNCSIDFVNMVIRNDTETLVLEEIGIPRNNYSPWVKLVQAPQRILFDMKIHFPIPVAETSSVALKHLLIRCYRVIRNDFSNLLYPYRKPNNYLSSLHLEKTCVDIIHFSSNVCGSNLRKLVLCDIVFDSHEILRFLNSLINLEDFTFHDILAYGNTDLTSHGITTNENVQSLTFGIKDLSISREGDEDLSILHMKFLNAFPSITTLCITLVPGERRIFTAYESVLSTDCKSLDTMEICFMNGNQRNRVFSELDAHYAMGFFARVLTARSGSTQTPRTALLSTISTMKLTIQDVVTTYVTTQVTRDFITGIKDFLNTAMRGFGFGSAAVEKNIKNRFSTNPASNKMTTMTWKRPSAYNSVSGNKRVRYEQPKTTSSGNTGSHRRVRKVREWRADSVLARSPRLMAQSPRGL